jgi:hypothetical protein
MTFPLLLGLMHCTIDYTLCIYNHDPSTCPPESLLIDVSNIFDLNSSTFPGAGSLTCFLTTSIPLTFMMLATFLPTQPRFSFLGIGAVNVTIDTSRPFKFEFQFTDLALILSSALLEVSSIGLTNTQIRAAGLVSISTMSFCSDFSSLSYIDEITSYSFQFLNFSPHSQTRTTLRRQGPALPSITFDGFTHDSLISFYGQDVALAATAGGVRVHLVVTFPDTRIIVNHTMTGVNVSLSSVYSRGLDARGMSR